MNPEMILLLFALVMIVSWRVIDAWRVVDAVCKGAMPEPDSSRGPPSGAPRSGSPSSWARALWVLRAFR